MDTADLETRLAAIDVAVDPDRWAMAAYGLAVARSELATTPDDLLESIRLLDKAGRILSPDRAPLEHGRIATARGHCHRSAGRPDLAVDDFGRAVELLQGRCEPTEEAAALVNIGLALTESGRAGDAVEPLTTAVDLLSTSPSVVAGGVPPGLGDDGERRTLGAALVNRAQAHQATRSADGLSAAAADYRAAANVLPPDSPQAAMAWHGLATALLERGGPDDTAEAVAAIEQTLSVFSLTAFPFQHAVARHSMAVALSRRAGDGGVPSSPVDLGRDLARAVHHGEAALRVFDPRLHGAQWRAVDELLTGLDDRLAGRTRLEVVLDLLGAVDEEERTHLIRDRLAPLASAPAVRLDGDLLRFCRGLTDLDVAAHQTIARSLISVLMELPDRLLDHAAAALVATHAAAENSDVYNRSLDDAIQARLFGPQRVRVRDLLEAQGWERP